MKDGRKKEFFICSVAELKTLETRFSRMAAKGWLIDKVNTLSCEYKKTEPRELLFFVDIIHQITAFDYPENDDTQEYRRICEELGWIFAASSRQMQVFYAEKKNDMPVPIHIDKKTEAQIMLKTSRKYELPFFLMGLAYLWFTWGEVIGKGYSLFLSNISMSQAVSVIAFTPPFLWYFGFILMWHFRTMLRVKNGLSAPEINYRSARIRIAVFAFAAIVTIISMLAGVALEVYGGAPFAVLAIAALPILGIFIGLYIRKQIDTIKRERKANIMLFVAGVTAAVILSMGATAFVIIHLGVSLSNQQILPEDKLALRLTDFGLETPPNAYNYFSHNSIAVPLNYNYYEINAGGSVRTDVKKARSSDLTNGIFQNLLEELNKKEWRLITAMTPVEAESWGALKGYYLNEAKTDVLLLYKSAILQIEYSGESFQADSIQKKAELIAYQ